MKSVIGHDIINGIPYINGKKAIWDGKSHIEGMGKVFSQYRCPECNAHLSVDSMICLNACHLSAASNRRFQAGIADAVARTKERD